MSENTEILSKAPPKGLKLERDVAGNGITLTYRRDTSYLSIFLMILFLMVFARALILGDFVEKFLNRNFDLNACLFGILFLSAVIVVIGSIFFALFGKRTLRLSEGQGTVFCGIWKIGRTWKFTYDSTSQVSIKEHLVKHGYRAFRDINIQTGNENFSFGDTIDVDDVRTYIAAVLDREIHR